MCKRTIRRCVILLSLGIFQVVSIEAQSIKPKFNNSTIYTGIEVGSKGVKMSVIEVGKNANGSYNILKDTSVNTDFISFTPATFTATLDGLSAFYTMATQEYKIPGKRVFTVISSGVKMQAEKDDKSALVKQFIDSFRLRIRESERQVEVVDVMKESMLSHLGIVPDSRRYSTFLFDIGSGNTKGGFFPDGTLNNFKMFQINWGTKSVFNATDKRLEDDKSLSNFNKQLGRVLSGAENSDIIYAVNSSGAYPLSDNIAVSGGIAWALATLMHPELGDNPVVAVNYKDVEAFNEKLLKSFSSLSPKLLTANIKDPEDKEIMMKEIQRAQQVFDQKSMLAGTGLLLRIMRQFESAFDSKQFFLVKNGQVGWVSAYVNLSVGK